MINMKKLLALLLLFGIVGCSATSNAPSEQWRINNDNNYNQNKKIKTLNVIANTPIISRIDSYDSLEAPLGTKLYKVETMNIETGERVTFQSTQSYDYKNNVYPFVNILALLRCEKLIKSECVVSKSNDFRVVGEDIRYSNIKEVRDEYSIVFANRARAEIEKQEEEDRLFEKDRELASIYSEAILANTKRDKEEKKAREEEKRLAVIYALKERCESYGFTGSNNIAACVQREAQHDYEIEQKEYELKLAQHQLRAQQNQNQLLAQQSQPQVAPEVPWYLQALEAVALGLAEGIEEGYKQKALIQTMDARYAKKDIYRYCRPNC